MQTKKTKAKEKPVPTACVCGAVPIDVTARGLGVCYFCKECLMRGVWKKNRDAAIESWNVEIRQARDNRSARVKNG